MIFSAKFIEINSDREHEFDESSGTANCKAENF